ncbi:MAG: helix-turn-helix transcriptional regulator [Egibacteraceae bacterium]
MTGSRPPGTPPSPRERSEVDLQLVGIHWIRHEMDEVLRVVTRCVAASRRLRLPILAKALLDLAGVHAVAGHREEMEEAIAEARAVAPDDPEVNAGALGNVYAYWWLREADDARATEALDGAMVIYRGQPGLPCTLRGMWALLRTVMGDGEEARDEVRAGPQLTMRINRRTLQYADAVALGQAGQAAEAGEAFAAAEAAVRIPGSWEHQHTLRLVAGAALRDGWGEPVAWLRQALGWFDHHGQERAASACRALLRQAGVTVPRRGRGDASVPDELRALGITSREMDVLRLVSAGLSNPEIAAELYLSPRTVDNHVGRLLARTGARGRAQLAALVTRIER